MAARSRLLVGFGVALAAFVGATAWWMLRGEDLVDTARASGAARAESAPHKADETTAPPAIVQAAAAEERQGLPGDPLPPPPPPPLEFEVYTTAGEPIADARVALCTQTAAVGTQKTDTNGLATFVAQKGDGRAIVLAHGVAPWIETVSLDAGRKRLTEPARESMHGVVRVDRGEPSARLEVRLGSDRPLFDLSSLSLELRGALEIGDNDATQLAIETDAHGAFEFRGLGPTFSGRIDLPRDLWIASCSVPTTRIDRESLRLDHLERALTIDALALPALTGRVVEVVGGAGVADATVEGWVGFVDPDTNRNWKLRAGSTHAVKSAEDGHFRLPIAVPRGVDIAALASADSLPKIESVGISVSRGEHSDSSGFRFTGAQLDGGWNVGELAIGAPRRLEFVVKDAKGAPIAGAIAIADSHSPPTDAQGKSAFEHLGRDTKSITVGKLGWHEHEVPLPPESSSPVEVVLEPTNVLGLDFVDANGAKLANQRATLIAPQALFQSEDPTRPSPTHLETGGTSPERTRRDDSGSVMMFRANDEGQATFSDLQPNVPLTLRITDELGQVLEERSLTIGSDENRRDEIQVKDLGLAFEGRVVDEHGEPLARANVRLWSKSLRIGDSRVTDAAGSFRFPSLKPGHVHLEVQRDGFSPWLHDDYELPLGVGPVELQLSSSVRLTLAIADDLGNAVPAQELHVRAAHHPNLPVIRRGPDTFELRDLPHETVHVVARVANVNYEDDLDPLGGDQRFVVPEHGKVLITLELAGSPEAGGEYHARVRAANNGRQVAVPNFDFAAHPPTAFVDAILPGDYIVDGQFWKLENNRRTGTTTFGPQVRVSVVGAKTAHVELKH